MIWKAPKDAGGRKQGQGNYKKKKTKNKQTNTNKQTNKNHNNSFYNSILTAHRSKGCYSVKAELCRETSLKEFSSVIVSPGA